MGKMKELYTIGQELQESMASGQPFAPSFEEVRAMQESYLELLRLTQRVRGIAPPEDQTSTP